MIQRKYKPPRTSRDSSFTNRTKLLSVNQRQPFYFKFQLRISRIPQSEIPTTPKCHLPQRRTCVVPVALPRETPCVVSPRPPLSALPRRQRIRPFPPKLRSFKKLSSRSLDSFRPRRPLGPLRSRPACHDARTRDALLLRILRSSSITALLRLPLLGPPICRAHLLLPRHMLVLRPLEPPLHHLLPNSRRMTSDAFFTNGANRLHPRLLPACLLRPALRRIHRRQSRPLWCLPRTTPLRLPPLPKAAAVGIAGVSLLDSSATHHDSHPSSSSPSQRPPPRWDLALGPLMGTVTRAPSGPPLPSRL